MIHIILFSLLIGSALANSNFDPCDYPDYDCEEEDVSIKSTNTTTTTTHPKDYDYNTIMDDYEKEMECKDLDGEICGEAIVSAGHNQVRWNFGVLHFTSWVNGKYG